MHGNVVACTEFKRMQITVTIKQSKTLCRHDQDRILDDQDFDLGRGQSIPQEAGYWVTTPCTNSDTCSMHNEVSVSA